MKWISFTTSASARGLLVQVRDDDDHAGHAELRVDDALSGESAAGALTFIGTHQTQWMRDLDSVAAIRAWVVRHAEAIDWNPRAWATVELALLTALAQRESKSLTALLDLRQGTNRPSPTAVLPENAGHLFDQHLMRAICDGYRDYKLSLTGIQAIDQSHIDALEAGRIAPTQTRAQATRLWTDPREAVDYLARLNYPFWAVEEPLAPGAYGDLAHLAYQLDTRIVLDDSLCRGAQLRKLGAETIRWVAMLRVGKLGGVLRALDFISTARRIGISMIAGDALSDGPSARAASKVLMASAGDALLAYEHDNAGSIAHGMATSQAGLRQA